MITPKSLKLARISPLMNLHLKRVSLWVPATLLLVSLGWAKAGQGASQSNSSLPAPDKLAEILKQDCTPQTKPIYAALHLGCRGWAEVILNRAPMESAVQNALLVVYDDSSVSLVALELRNDEWRHVDTRFFQSKYDEPKVSFPSLVAPGIHEVAVSQETLIRGTGVLENHQVIYKLLNGKLRLVFDERAKALLNGWGTATDWQEQSEFRYAPASKGQIGTIFQRSVYQQHSQSTVIFRCFAWDVQTLLFREMPSKDYSNSEWNKLAPLYPGNKAAGD